MAAQEASGRSSEPSPRGLLPESLEDPAEGESARQDQVFEYSKLLLDSWD